jgi:hypothetical protein
MHIRFKQGPTDISKVAGARGMLPTPGISPLQSLNISRLVLDISRMQEVDVASQLLNMVSSSPDQSRPKRRTHSFETQSSGKQLASRSARSKR